MNLKPWTRQISYGHRAMYMGPAALMGGARVSVIDVGCGDGYGYHTLVSADAVSKYFGIDRNSAEVEQGRKLLVSRDHSMWNLRG